MSPYRCLIVNFAIHFLKVTPKPNPNTVLKIICLQCAILTSQHAPHRSEIYALSRTVYRLPRCARTVRCRSAQPQKAESKQNPPHCDLCSASVCSHKTQCSNSCPVSGCSALSDISQRLNTFSLRPQKRSLRRGERVVHIRSNLL